LQVRGHFGDQDDRSTFAGFSLCGEAPNVGEAVRLYAVRLPDVAQQQKQKSNEDCDVQR
jgi:hypothetical protein